MQLFKWFKEASQKILVYAIFILILANAAVILYIRNEAGKSEDARLSQKELQQKITYFLQNASSADIAARDYMIVRSDESISTYQKALGKAKTDYDSLNVQLSKDGVEQATLQNLIANVGGALTVHRQF